jgi:hypothetical protein
MATYCPKCGRGSWACACDLSLTEKLRTLTIHPDATPNKPRVYDSKEALGSFGPDAKEEMLEETRGLGPAFTRGGRPWRKDRRSGEWQPVTERELDRVYMGGDSEQDGNYEPGPL